MRILLRCADQSFGGSTNSSRAGMLGTVKEANDSALNDANAALVLRTNTQTKASALQRLKVGIHLPNLDQTVISTDLTIVWHVLINFDCPTNAGLRSCHSVQRLGLRGRRSKGLGEHRQCGHQERSAARATNAVPRGASQTGMYIRTRMAPPSVCSCKSDADSLECSFPLQVFSLDASQNVDAAAARRQLQNYLATMSSFRGRALAGGPLAMPPTSRHALDEVRRTVEMVSPAPSLCTEWLGHVERTVSYHSALCRTT